MVQHPLLQDPIARAREIGDQICATAEPVGDGRRWLSRHDAADDQGYWCAIYAGAAGVGFFLIDLYARTGESRYRDIALQAAHWLEGQVAAGNEELSGPSLICGRGSLAYFYWRAAIVLEDRALLDRAEAHAEACAAMEQKATEMIVGAPGTGLLFLEIYGATGNDRYLRLAEEMGEFLMRSAERVGAGVRWPFWAVPPDNSPNRCYTGFAHGAAGSASFLLDLFHVTRDDRFAELARAAGRRLLEIAERDGPVWVWDCLDPATDSERLVQWCHGAPGNGLFFLRAAAILGDDDFRDATERCAEATWAAGDIRGNPSQCHGLCGNAELFLEIYRLWGEARYQEMAYDFAEKALRYRHETERGIEWDSHTLGIVTPDYMIGSAGVGQFFLRLADPVATRTLFLGTGV